MKATRRQRIKLTLTSCMSLLSIILFCLFPSVFKFICVIAMLASSIGDVILMDYKPFTSRLKIDLFTAGMLSFGIAHMLYIALFISKAFALGASLNIGTYTAIGITLVAICSLITVGIKKKSISLSLLSLGIVYIVILSLNLCAVSTLAFSIGGLAYLTLIGALSFFISDMIIAFDKVKLISGGEIPIWIFYVIGQMFLITGA